MRAGASVLLHTKSLAIYANTIFPRNKPNPIAQCLVLVLTCSAGFGCQGFHFQGDTKYYVEMRHQTTRRYHLVECVHCGWFGWRCNHSTQCGPCWVTATQEEKDWKETLQPQLGNSLLWKLPTTALTGTETWAFYSWLDVTILCWDNIVWNLREKAWSTLNTVNS